MAMLLLSCLGAEIIRKSSSFMFHARGFKNWAGQ